MKRIKTIRPLANMGQSVVMKRTASVVSYEENSSWLWREHRVTLLQVLPRQKIKIRLAGTGESVTIGIGELKPYTDSAPSRFANTQPAIELSRPDAPLARAAREHQRILTLLQSNDRSLKALDTVAEELHISLRTLQRRISRTQVFGTPDALMPRRPGPSVGSNNLTQPAEALIRQEIRMALSTSPDIAASDLFPLIVDTAVKLGLRPPSLSTVGRRLSIERLCIANLPSHIGNELAYRRSPVVGSIQSEGALSIVDIDHTVCDVHVVEPNHRYPIGRPVLTIMHDRSTRVVLGILLSLEAPSIASVGLCLHHGVFPKDSWLDGLGEPQACWPGFGLPRQIITDHGSEFLSSSFRSAAQRWGIDIAYRPLGHPAAGGIIEREIGSVMTKLRLLPGTSFSKLLKAPPSKAAERAQISLAELLVYVVRQISVFHRTHHRGIGMPPLTAWERSWATSGQAVGPRIPDDADAFRIGFMPGMRRAVTREGVRLASLVYQAPALILAGDRGQRRWIRYDPRDMTRVFVEMPDRHIIVGLRDQSIPPFSMWEWREIRRHQVEQGRSRDVHLSAAEIRRNRDEINHRSGKASSIRHARRIARLGEWRRSWRPDEVDSDRKSEMVVRDIPTCEVGEVRP